MRVLVDSPPFPIAVLQGLLVPDGLDVEARRDDSRGNDIVALLPWEPVGEADFARFPGLKVVACCSIGYDHVDLEAAARRGVWVCNVPDYCVEEVADTTIAFVLALLRGIVTLDRSVRADAWDDHAAGELRRLEGTTLGIIGFGRIGRAVGRRAVGLRFEVLAHDPFLQPDAIASVGARPRPLDNLLRESRVITLHLPLTGHTRSLLGRRELALMPSGSYLVNTARAGLVDWPALMEALESGRLAGAATDVLLVEPPTDAHPAPQHPRLIVTPHAAWYSPESEREVYARATRAVVAALSGRDPEGAIVVPRLSAG